MKPRILGINGIRTDGSTSTDKMLKQFDNHPTIDVNYPKVRLWGARSRSRQYRNARQLVNKHIPGDVLIAHSYGCLLALRAMELGAKFSHVFLFAPAMNRDFTFPYLGMTKLHVIHNANDKAVKAGALLAWHDVGEMGRFGYDGPPDPRITNIIDTDKGDSGKNHSHYFSNRNVGKWAKFVMKTIIADGSSEIK